MTEVGNGGRGVTPRPLTCDEELLCCLGPAFPPLPATDPARIRRIAAELSDGFRRLDGLTRAVSMFGSARLADSHPAYALARETARRLSAAGFAVITGGGPGIMEAANRGARDAGALSVGLNIELPFEQRLNPYVDPADVPVDTGMITAVDAGRLQVTDDPGQVVAWVDTAWRAQPRSRAAFHPAPASVPG